MARRDRRPMLAALAILLILLGALGSALVAFRSGDRQSVLVANRPIAFGATVSAQDLVEVRVAADTGAGVLDAGLKEQLVGARTLTAIPRGTVLNNNMFTRESAVPSGGELVGLVLGRSQRPAVTPRTGQVVRVYFVAGGSGSTGGYAPGNAIVEAARIVSVDDAGSDSIGLTVLVDQQKAGELASLASAGNVAISLLPDTVVPKPDTQAVE